MNWERLATVDVFQLERNESLLDSLYEFLEKNELSAAEISGIDSGLLAKTLSVVQRIMKVKGEEAKVAMEELIAQQQQQQGNLSEGGAPNERALMNQIMELERELRDKERAIEGMNERGSSPASGAVHEVRVIKQENEDLKLELCEVKRRLDIERSETDRLSGEATTERLKSRQLEREIDQLKNDLEEHRKHLQNRGDIIAGAGGGGASLLRAGEREYRERLRQKDLEIAEQLDKIEELLNVRDELEKQCQDLSEDLGRAEEQRIACLRDSEEASQALLQADHHCSGLEIKNKLLEGQISDLRECLQEKAEAEQEIQNLFTEKNKECQSAIEAKDYELIECHDQLQRLQALLTEADKDSNRAAVIKMKKQLQDREQELNELQEELAGGAAALEELSAQLEEERMRSTPSVVNTAQQKALEVARTEADGLKQALNQEIERRKECEVTSVERETELAHALMRLGEYERGEYGLREAVLEIKTKREEILVRDRDIEQLTQQVNQLDRQVNQLSEFNEMLCERFGVGEREETEFVEWRAKREGVRERLEMKNKTLQRKVESLEEEKLILRKRLVAHRHTAESANTDRWNVDREREREEEGGRDETDDPGSAVIREDLRPVIAELNAQLVQLQRECAEVTEDRNRLASKMQQQIQVYHLTQGERGREDDEMTRKLKSSHEKFERKSFEAENLKKEVEFLRQAASGFQPVVPLPDNIPMTSHDVISSLNEHLLHTLKAEKGWSQECETMRTALEKYQLKFSVIMNQLGVLYKEYFDSKNNWEREKEQTLQRSLEEEQRASKAISELRHELARTKEQAATLQRSLKDSLKTLQDQLLQKDRELSEMKLASICSKGSEKEERDRQRIELIESERGRHLAEESARQLQALVTQKDRQSERYRQLLQEARSELRSMTEARNSEVTSLVKKLHKQSDSTFEKLKRESLEAVAMPVVTGATEYQLARLHELEDLIGQQRVSYEAKLLDMRRENELAKHDYETSLVRVRQEMGELKTSHFIEKERLLAESNRHSARVVELEQELEVMSGELSAAQEAARQAPSKTTKSLIEKLRKQLATKEKQQKALNEALLQVRAELLDATQKALLGHTHHEVKEVNIQKLVQKRTSELEDRVRELSTSVNGLRTELEMSRERESDSQRAAEEAIEATERLRMSNEAHKREEERWKREGEEGREGLRKMEGELQQNRTNIEQLRAKEQRLLHELQIVQQRSDHKPQVQELERKLKVLQTRFDRQKQQIDSLRQQQKVVHVAVTPNKCPPTAPEEVHTGPLIRIRQSSSSSESVLRWEENKKWQRKVDGLRSRLVEKTKEAESAVSHVTSLKEMLERNEREKRFLQNKIKSLQKTLTQLENKRQDTVSNSGFHGNGGVVGYRGDQVVGDHSPSTEELQRVISAMRNVVEKLQKENDKLKREALIRMKDRGKNEEKQSTNDELKRHPVMMKLAAENERLRKSLKHEMERNQKLQLSLKSTEMKAEARINEKSEGVMYGSSGRYREEQDETIEQLSAEVEKKSQMLMEVKTHLKDMAERERERDETQRQVVGERDALKEQVELLHKELASFEPSFFEEVEDLKFNYQESIKKNIEYEQKIVSLSQQLGVSPPTFNT